jgi:hypothetical protein
VFPHHIHVDQLPEDTVEVVLCTDGLPEASETAAVGQTLLAELRQNDPFLTGKNRLEFTANAGGFVTQDGVIADCYDDLAYIRVAV